MNPSQFYLSTIAPDGPAAAAEFGMGLELAQFCTASNIDDHFSQTDAQIRRQLAPGQSVIFHAPFNELFPCAIDPKARELAAFRYRQAVELAKGYGAEKVVIHGGYHPRIYFPEWYVEQSVEFWKEFLKEDPGIQIVLENVLEPEMDWLMDIVKAVRDPNLRLCLDVGHVNAYSQYPVMTWLEAWSPYLSHFHIHNNDGSWDTHSGLDQGSIPMKDLLCRADALCPDATYTLEVTEAAPAVCWLQDNHLIGKR